MRDFERPAWMYLKAGLLVFTGILSCALLLIEHPTLKAAVLLLIAIWSSCRAYYFIFYVIERYIDPSYKFSGLMSFAAHLLRKRNS